MSKTLQFETWDVFTQQRFAGNPLAVVFGADRLPTGAMQALAREFNYSETVFVLDADALDCEARLRIFTPAGELPFAGHPTVGAAVAIARRRDLQGSLELELVAGRFAVQVDPFAGHAEFANPNMPCVIADGPNPDVIELALGLPRGSVCTGEHRPRRCGAGIDFVYAQTSLAVVQSARLNPSAWSALRLEDACGVLLFAPGSGTGPDWHVRMFAPHIGVPEDPATGSAAAALPAQLLAAKALPDGSHTWCVEQGVEMGRPSRIDVRFEVVAGGFDSLHVGGYAVTVSAGEIHW